MCILSKKRMTNSVYWKFSSYLQHSFLHYPPSISPQPREASKANFDAGQVTAETDTPGEREADCEAPDHGRVEGVAGPECVHHSPRWRVGRAGEDLRVVVCRVEAAGALLPPGHHQPRPDLQPGHEGGHRLLLAGEAVVEGNVLGEESEVRRHIPSRGGNTLDTNTMSA